MSLIRIEYKPARSPMLFSQYIMDELRFNEVFREIFTRDDVLRIYSRTTTKPTSLLSDDIYNLEIYLPTCKIMIQRTTSQINAHRLLYQSDFYGNVDILQHVSEQF